MIAVTDRLIAYCRMAILVKFGTITLGVYLLYQWVLDRVVEFKILPGGMLRCLIVSVFLFLSFFGCCFEKKSCDECLFVGER